MTSEQGEILERELPAKVVVIGDLNGYAEVLRRMLTGLRLIKKNGQWMGGRTVLVQLGDVPNRGPTPKAAMELLLELKPQAQAAGGDVIWVLGNHEVLSALRHEAYVSVEEYMEWATEMELEEFYINRHRYQLELLVPPEGADHVAPVGGRLRVWEEQNAPGKAAYRLAMGSSGTLGRAIRSLPVAVRIGPLLMVHGGLTPRWASRGLEGLERARREAWGAEPRFYEELDPYCVFRDPQGPLWNRTYCLAAPSALVRKDLQHALDRVDAAHMIVGHTRSDALRDGVTGRPSVRHGGRLVMVDVGLGDPGEPGTALVIEKGRMEAWSPGGARSKIQELKRGA